jgi:membrane associated rhomboid family serine protease
MKSRQDLRKAFINFISLNKCVFIAAGLVTIISFVIFALNSLNSIVNQILSSSIYTPWGVVTSMFAHSGLEHIEGNLFVLWVWILYIILQNAFMKDSFISKDDIKKRLKFSMKTVFVAVIIANIIWLIMHPYNSILGSSGIVFAFAGVLMGFSFTNLSYIFRSSKNQSVSIKRKLSSLAWNVFVCLFFAVSIFLYPTTFLAEGPQVNVFIHGISFLIAFYSVFAYEYPKLFPKSLFNIFRRRKYK